MKKIVINNFKKITPLAIKNLAKRFIFFVSWDPWVNYSWAQEGEDGILGRFFGDQQTGFYIDVGAHHPKRFSNTFAFYKRGWRGINIDAMPGLMKTFDKVRRRDINIEIGVGLESCVLDYYLFNEPALNSFSKEISDERHLSASDYRITGIIPVKIRPLSLILDEHLPKGQVIDFMTIDVEGFDYDVLQSNDWKKYRPKIILVEILGSSMHEIQDSSIGRLMTAAGYVLYAKCINTVLFKAASLK